MDDEDWKKAKEHIMTLIVSLLLSGLVSLLISCKVYGII